MSYSSNIVKPVLRMVYTGVVKEDPIAFVSIAAEFDLPWLKGVAEKICSESIKNDNLEDIWQAARLYD